MYADDQTNSDDTRSASTSNCSRRTFLRGAGALSALAAMNLLQPRWTSSRTTDAPSSSGLLRPPALEPTFRGGGRVEYDLEIARTPFEVDGRQGSAITLNGSVPGPLIRLQEGEEAVLRYTNALEEETSIHWHGLLIPNRFDGVPGINFPGVAPGETFEVRFPVRQYGTYWYHSHSGLQEQLGHYGPLVIDPADSEPHPYDRELVVVLSDWTFEDPHAVFANLKKGEGYYNFQKRTVGDFFEDASEDGLWRTIKDRLSWGRMRMSPTDISDVTGATYTYLMNGLGPASNWTGIFKPGERVRIRFVNASAATIFDVRIPGLEMDVVQVSGQNVEAVSTDEFRIGVAERYDVIVEPTRDRAHTIFAEAIDRSGYARGTLAPRQGMEASIPERRDPPQLTMADMGMMHGGMEGMEHGDMDMQVSEDEAAADTSADGMGHEGMDHSQMNGMNSGGMEHESKDSGMMGADNDALRPPGTLPDPVMHDQSRGHGPGEAGLPMMTRSRLDEPGIGLGDDGRRVLTYSQLRALDDKEEFRAPDREIELHLTGNMERFMWAINGVEYSEADPIMTEYGERIRLTIVNDTMMNHPMHLHGMFMELENGYGDASPLIDTVTVKPAERVSGLVTMNEPGPWFFHCHILYHMDSGMARVFHVSTPPGDDTEFYFDPQI